MDINEIMNNLKNGLRYSDGFRGFYLDREGYICYNHFGSSAVKATIDNLKWLIEVIFENDLSNYKIGKNLFVNMY